MFTARFARNVLLCVPALMEGVSSYQKVQAVIENDLSRPALKSHHKLEAYIESKLESLDRTVGTVETIVDLVNESAQKVISHGLSTRRGLASALLEAKTNAKSLKSVLGDEISATGELFFERLGETLETLPGHLEESDGRMQGILLNILDQFHAAGNASRDNYELGVVAVLKLGALRKSKTSLLLLETDKFSKLDKIEADKAEMEEKSESEGIVDWFSKTFGKGSTPCGQARNLASDADRSVDRMVSMLVTLNHTCSSNLLEGAVESIKETRSQVKQVMKVGAATYASKLPANLLGTVANTVDATGAVVERMHTKVLTFEAKISRAIRVAVKHVSALHEASDALLAEINESCNDKA